jgi:hypothetical protein
MGLKPARNTFLGAADLKGCLVVVQAHEKGTAPSTVPGAAAGATYDWVRATVAVLDGEVSEALAEQAARRRAADRAGGHPVRQGRHRQRAEPHRRWVRRGRDAQAEGGPDRHVHGQVPQPGTSPAGRADGHAEFKVAADYVNANPDVFPERDPFAAEGKAAKAFA